MLHNNSYTNGCYHVISNHTTTKMVNVQEIQWNRVVPKMILREISHNSQEKGGLSEVGDMDT